tara:strand:+ start:7576 stop:7863 length:288 start_codon:yes stop_codon:yes gene_type:complete
MKVYATQYYIREEGKVSCMERYNPFYHEIKEASIDIYLVYKWRMMRQAPANHLWYSELFLPIIDDRIKLLTRSKYQSYFFDRDEHMRKNKEKFGT